MSCLPEREPHDRARRLGSRDAQKDFFRRTKQSLRLPSWEQVLALLSSTGAEITSRSLRRWRLGHALPPRSVTDRMNQLAGQQMDQMAVIIRPRGWGAKKGGLEKFARCGCNLTLRDRMKGGKIVGKSQSTQHLGHIGSIGGVNSVKSASNARRKVLGQFGMMYNELEKECLAALLQAGFVVDYEPTVFVGERRIIPDFRVGDVYIECTGDPKVNAKAERFLEKFELIEKYEGNMPRYRCNEAKFGREIHALSRSECFCHQDGRLSRCAFAESMKTMVGPAGFEPATPRCLKDEYQSCAPWSRLSATCPC